MKKYIVSVCLVLMLLFSFDKIIASSFSLSSYSAVFDSSLFLAIDSLTFKVFIPHDTIAKSSLSKKEFRKKKFVSAVFAFPFPFGFMGAHRVLLGTKPWVPIVYVATFGGCFGVIPLIDFFAILFSKDESQFENKAQIFMWLK